MNFLMDKKQKAKRYRVGKKRLELYDIEKLKKEAEEFNTENNLYKKGISFMPICFGISFTKTLMNQARALVHVYMDGSVNVSTGAVEMGQGVNTKMLQVAATIFSIDANKSKSKYYQYLSHRKYFSFGGQCHR